MGVTKLVYGGVTKFDISDTTAVANKVLTGYTFYDNTGVKQTGTFGATITVSYGSEYYDKTMTCSDGTTTYTATTTSSGSTQFKVSSAGTWTVTCDGASIDIEVVFDYTSQFVATVTVPIYSAASDTVSFTDATGSKTVTTDSTGVGTANITFTLPNQEITFTSSVAKLDLTDTDYFSKTVEISSSITEVAVMPVDRSAVVYWYGYTDSGSVESTYNSVASKYTLTHNTNNITFVGRNSSSAGGDYTAWMKRASGTVDAGIYAHGIVTTGVVNAARVGFHKIGTLNKQAGLSGDFVYVNTTNNTYTKLSLQTEYPAISATSASNTTVTIYALWYTPYPD